MFFLDSLMISGIRWTLETVVTAAEAELNDDTALREQLLDAEMRRELGEIDDEAFRVIESDLLARIRTIRERREGGMGPLAIADGAPLETAEGQRFNVEASLAGDFHDDSGTHEATPMAGVSPAAIAPPTPRAARGDGARRALRPQSRGRAAVRKRSS
jgi:hypothetical protein